MTLISINFSLKAYVTYLYNTVRYMGLWYHYIQISVKVILLCWCLLHFHNSGTDGQFLIKLMNIVVVLWTCEMEVKLTQLNIGPKILCSMVIDLVGGDIPYKATHSSQNHQTIVACFPLVGAIDCCGLLRPRTSFLAISCWELLWAKLLRESNWNVFMTACTKLNFIRNLLYNCRTDHTENISASIVEACVPIIA
jgi:hypothetical protein